MDIAPLHPWLTDVSAAIALQKALAQKVVLQPLDLKLLRRIAGVDVSSQRGSCHLWAAVVVLDFPTLSVVEEAFAVREENFPYVPGLLSFRELPVVIEALRQLQQPPDLAICDGQGLAHPRFFGLACHLGVWLNLPTIGCAKSRLVGESGEPAESLGARAALYFQDRLVGATLRTRRGSKPVFVSPGQLSDVDSACEIVSACCRRCRLPEPTRLAHLAVNRFRQTTAI